MNNDNSSIIFVTNNDKQKYEEVLMLYTCYPVNGLGHKTDRFVVYAKKVE